VNTVYFELDWLLSGNNSPEIHQTMGMFGLRVDDVYLTRNEDTWSHTIRDKVLVSAYPIATWLASSWWRLLFEPLPPINTTPSVDWRMAHELAAANQGFIWPKVILASDTNAMQIWSASTQFIKEQSVNYITNLDRPMTVRLPNFEKAAEQFIETVLSRLQARGTINTELAPLWSEIQEERADPTASRYRRCEAELGFDPDECSESLVSMALDLDQIMGNNTFLELASAGSQNVSKKEHLDFISGLPKRAGLTVKPNIPIDQSLSHQISVAPWQLANQMALKLRRSLDLETQPITNDSLCELIGLSKIEYEGYNPLARQSLSVAIPAKDNKLNLHPRKRHPIAKRFEFTRFIGDYLLYGDQGSSWLASTDLRTARQKYQRAFAAEFLCPIDSLKDYLNEDYSETALEDAADHFGVSQQTIELILANYGLITPPQPLSYETNLPY
jgi:hypothetical protein